MAETTFVLKLRRAREHFNAFNEAAKWWLETQPHRIEEEVDAEADRKQIVVIADTQPPERLSLMLGDAVQNFRSALDYLVGDFARANSGGYLMPRIESDLQFPITTDRGKFKSALRQGRLGLVPTRVVAQIQRVQPYRHGQDPERNALSALHQISNIDKHRRIPLLTSVVEAVQFSHVLVGSVNNLEMGMTGPFKHKAVLLA